MSDQESITRWLERLREGDARALDCLVPILYEDLRQIARKQLRAERREHTLGATALVNEAYLRLAAQERLNAADRTTFFAIAGRTMRRVLVDYARTRKRLKRGGGEAPIPLAEAESFLSVEEADEVLALNDALDRLAAVNERGALVVQHRFFAGLTLEETAELLGVSSKTVQRDWLAARAWLRKEVHRDIGR
jgi:RNA polymerase sigma factor (TIGR02999 family)